MADNVDMKEAVLSGTATPQQTQDYYNQQIKQTAAENAASDALQDQYGSRTQQLEAGAAGLARGVSLGLSDLALTKSGAVSPETLKGLQTANPAMSNVGQLVGGAGLVGLTGGASAFTEGAGSAAQIAGTSAEGGLFGAGNALSDYAMGDPNLNAQKIAAHIGTGALFGAGLGALGETVEATLPKATEALSNATQKIKDLTGSTEDTINPLSSDVSETTPPSWSDKFNLGLKYGIEGKQIKSRELNSNLQSLDTASGKAAKALYEEAVPANIGEALKDMPLSTAQENSTNTINSMKEQLNGIGDTTPEPTTPLSSPSSIKIVNSAIDDLENSIGKAKSAYDVQNSLSKFAKDIDSKKIIKFDTLPTASQMSDQDVLMGIRNTIRGDLKNPDLWGDAATHYSQVSDAYSAFKTAQTNFRKSFMVKQASSTGRPIYVISPSKVDSLFNRFDDVSQDLKKQYMNEFINQTNSIAKASENYHGYKQGEKSISDYVDSLANKNEDLRQVAQIMGTKGSGNSSLQGLTAIGAHTLGIPDAVTGAAVLASKAYKAISNPYELGSTLNNTFSKLKAIGDILQKSTKSIDLGAKSIFSGNTSRAISSGLGSLSEKQYTKHADRIQELSNNPDELMKHLDNTTKALYEAAPNISTGLHSTITNGIQFLQTKLPKPMNELPLNAPWMPSFSQKAKFNKYFGAVNNPIKVLDQIKDGSLSNEEMEALQAVHPELLQQMQQKVMENMTAKKLPSLNYSTKIALSKFLGQPLESGMLPQVIASNQATFALPSKNDQQPKSQGKSTLGGLKQLTTGKMDFTRTQDLEQDMKKA